VNDLCLLRKMHELHQSRSTRALRQIRSEDTGGALVEMAVILPLLLVMLTGIFSFSIALHQKLQLAEALSAGGRVLALERSQGDPCADTAYAIYAAAPGLDPSKLTLSITVGTTTGGTITGGTTYPAAQGAAPTCKDAGQGGGSALAAGWGGQITATYPCSFAVYGVDLGSCNIATQVTEVIQ
jgi:Flp pilus assembly protein TadG